MGEVDVAALRRIPTSGLTWISPEQWRAILIALERAEQMKAEIRELRCDLHKAAWAQCGCLGGTISHYEDREACQ